MSYRTSAEQDLKVKISENLSRRASNLNRAWLDPKKYKNDISFSSKPAPLLEERIIYPVYSYEIFDMEEVDLQKFVDDICYKVEKFFIDKISLCSDNSVVNYHEDSIELSLEYRIALLKIKYSLTF